MKIWLFALCRGLFLLAECASGWVKPGASQQDLAEDRTTCLKEAHRPSGPVFINPLTGFFSEEGHTDSHTYKVCIREHGWSPSGG